MIDRDSLKKTVSNRLSLIIPALLLLIFLGIGIYYFQFYLKNNKTSPAKSQTVTPSSAPAQNLSTSTSLAGNLPQFAQYQEKKTVVTPAIAKYTLSAQELINIREIEKGTQKNLSPAQLNALSAPGFFLTPAENKLQNGDEEIDFRGGGTVDEFLFHYKDIAGKYSPEERLPENTVFVTSDLLLHVFHVYLDRTFQYIEETKFHPKLKDLTDMLYQQSLSEYDKTADTQLKASFSRLSAFFLVPKIILETSVDIYNQKQQTYNPENTQQETEQITQKDETVDKPENILVKLDTYKDKLPPTVYQRAQEELQLINQAEGTSPSPLFGEFKNNQLEDYTQFKPRSHYQKNSLLRSYWKAMIWYGRNGFLIKSDALTMDAIIQTMLLKKNAQALNLWESIYLPTVFFVGKSDDLTIYDYNDLIIKIYGESANFGDLANKDKLGLFKEELKKLAGPKIQSSIVMVVPDAQTKEEVLLETMSFRFMGQRFIPDSFIFSSLTRGDEAPDKETGQKLPAVPTALMPLSIFGSNRAQVYLDKWISQKAPDSDKVIAKEKKKLEDAFGKLGIKDWNQNLYWSWLYTLKSLFQTFSEGYPMFMQSEAWNDKDLNTALGSYTELRHDTLLYAKQSYAELGGARELPTPPPVPKGYIEPNIVLLNRIIALAQMTKQGLETTQVMPEEQKSKIEQFIESLTFYREIVKKELTNQVITDDEFEKLRVSTLRLNDVLTPPSTMLQYMKASEARSGLIADVHTAMNINEILYEATGIPNIIYVAVKDANGTRLTRGVTYSYYEFTHPFGERLSDADWQANIYEGKNNFPLPSKPEWAKSLEK